MVLLYSLCHLRFSWSGSRINIRSLKQVAAEKCQCPGNIAASFCLFWSSHFSWVLQRFWPVEESSDDLTTWVFVSYCRTGETPLVWGFLTAVGRSGCIFYNFFSSVCKQARYKIAQSEKCSSETGSFNTLTLGAMKGTTQSCWNQCKACHWFQWLLGK